MLQSLLNTLLSCSHNRITFPLTPGRKNGGYTGPDAPRTYVVCLDCGKELAYDWDSMRIGKPVTPSVRAAEAQPVVSRS